ncbi:MAG: cytochrome c biogenesis protein CcsA [Kofleriaceae bacterium]
MKQTNSPIVPALGVVATLGILATVWGVFVATPMDRNLFYSQKIFYYHLPNAFMLFLSVFVCGIASIGVLKRRDSKWDDVALAAAELSVLYGAIVLATGSIWARAAWGHWWIWEPRLMSSLVLWLIMVGYVLLRRFAGPGSERLAAGLAVFGMVDVPLIYYGVKQGDAHPQATVVQALTGTMKLTLWGSVLSFFFLFLALLLHRVQVAAAERETRELRERALDAGLFA